MGMLDKNKQRYENPSTVSARQLARISNHMVDQLLSQWHLGWDTLWSSEDPAEVLYKLDTDASDLFELNDKVVKFLTDVLTDRRPEDLNKILDKLPNKPTTKINTDGTVTIG